MRIFRSVRLVPRHRRLARHVSRAGRDPAPMHTGDVAEIRADADIDDVDLRTSDTRQRVHARAAGEKIRHHLPGNR